MPHATAKTPATSRVEMTQMVLPGDANPMGTAFGGKIMQWIDIAAAVAARRHAGCVAVTAAMDSLKFHEPIHLGDVVVLHASVNHVWRSSMEVGVRVEVEPQHDQTPRHAASAYLTFVAIDGAGRPCAAPRLEPASDDERRRHQQAERRRAQRLARI